MDSGIATPLRSSQGQGPAAGASTRLARFIDVPSKATSEAAETAEADAAGNLVPVTIAPGAIGSESRGDSSSVVRARAESRAAAAPPLPLGSMEPDSHADQALSLSIATPADATDAHDRGTGSTLDQADVRRWGSPTHSASQALGGCKGEAGNSGVSIARLPPTAVATSASSTNAVSIMRGDESRNAGEGVTTASVGGAGSSVGAGDDFQAVDGFARKPLRELGKSIASGGGGGGSCNSGPVLAGRKAAVVAGERLAAVRCYLRDDDPIFIRRNLRRLQEGVLARLAVGDTVTVARRCRGGENNEGGPGTVTRVLPELFYDIKYAVGGVEKGVDACFVEKTSLLESNRKRRGGTPRCPDCHSFLHECTCQGFLDASATAVVEAPASATGCSTPSSSSLHSQRSHSLKRPRSAMGKDADVRAGSENTGEGEEIAPEVRDPRGPNQIAEQGLPRQEKWREDTEQEEMDVEELNHSDGNESRDNALNDPEQSNVGPRRLSDSRERTHRFLDEERESRESSGDGEETWTQRAEVSLDAIPGDDATEGIVGVVPGLRDAASAGGVRCKDNEVASRIDAECVGDVGGGGSAPALVDENYCTPEWRPRKGDLVDVERRMSPGVNKLGGFARVVKVDPGTGAVDVRYVVEGGWERGIDLAYVRPADLDLGEKRPTLGRCPHCGSLRIDCNQSCEFYTAPPSSRILPRPPSLLPANLAGRSSGGFSQDGVARTSDGLGRRPERRRQGRRSRLSSGGGLDRDRRDDSRRERRHLPDDWDEEGEPVPGGDGLEGRRSGSDNNSDTSARHRRRRIESDSDQTVRVYGWGSSSSSGSNDADYLIAHPLRRHEHREAGGDAASGSDSDVEVLHIREARESGHTRRHASRGSSRVSESSPPPSSGSDVSGAGDREQGSGKEDSRSPKRGVGTRGGRRDAEEASNGGGRPALFLMPEGEEAARMLPSDIADPTRGVKDPMELRKELKNMLEDMESRDAAVLELEVPAACRRVAAAASRGAGPDRSLKTDLQALVARVTRTLRRLDVANNIFVRLEKLEVRWREGLAGTNAWHRLSGVSERLEQLRRDANKAIRDHARSTPGGEDTFSSSSDESGRSSAGSGNSSADFDLGTRTHPRQERRPSGGKQLRGNASGRRSSSASGRTRRAKRNRGETRSAGAGGDQCVGSGRSSGDDVSGGSEGGSFAASTRSDDCRAAAGRRSRGDRRGNKRPKPSSSGGRQGRGRSAHTRRRAGADGRFEGRGLATRGGTWTLPNLEEQEGAAEPPYLLGLDYSMAAESDENGAGDWRSRDSSSPVSSATGGSSSPSSHFSRSRSRSRSPLPPSQSAPARRRGGDGARLGRSARSSGGQPRSSGSGKHRSAAEDTTGGREGGRRGAGASVVAGRDGSRRGSAEHRKGNRGAGQNAAGKRGGSSSGAGRRGSERHSRRGASARHPRVGAEINGRALMEEQYLYRLAQQEARRGPQPSERNASAAAAVAGRMQQLQGQAALSLGQGEGARPAEGTARGSPSAPARLPTLVEDLAFGARLQHHPLKFRTLYTKTLGTTEVTMGDIALDVGGVDPCAGPREPDMVADSRDRERCDGNGELVRALNALPQRMADLEELATTRGMDDEGAVLAEESSKIMAVIGAKLRHLCCSPAASPHTHTGTRQPSRDDITGVKRLVDNLAEACAPGRGGDDAVRDKGCFPGLSLTRSVHLGEKFRGSVGSKALMGACAAIHAHLLEWLAVTDEGLRRMAAAEPWIAPGEEGAASGGGILTLSDVGPSASASARPTQDGRGVSQKLPDSVLDFARRLLLDLLFLFEKRVAGVQAGSFAPAALGGRGATDPHPPSAPLHVSRDPLAELLSAVMDTLDGARGDELPPGPVATVSVPGLAQPLVGFWGVFFDIICGGPSAPVSGEGGGGAGAGGGRNCSSSSWNTGLPSELVWKALLHAFRVSSLRRGWDENAFGIGTTVAGSRGGSPVGGCAPEDPGAAGSAAATAAAAAHRRRRKDTSRSLWECVRLLLAASPFSVEFGGRGQAFAVTVTAQATSTAATSKGRRYAANGAAGSSSFEPVTAVAESFSAPGMVARMLLERVLVLARFRAPEAGVHGVVEKLWEGVQRISATLSIMDSERSEDRGAGTSDRTAEGRNSLRVRSARKSRAASADFSRLLSGAVEAWCLPVHRLCLLPEAVIQGTGGGRGRGEGSHGQGDYEGLCALMSLITQEHAMRLPEGLKRRKLANGLLKAKYSPPPGSSEARLDEDDVHVLAPTRVLLGIALGLARAGLIADATKELVKAAAVRPRNITPDAPRDRSIALIAPAATALCLVLARLGCKESAGASGIRMTLFEVLAACMKDAVDLMARVLDAAGRLGQAVNLERLERPLAAVGLSASCILVALRCLGPSSQPPPSREPPDSENASRGGAIGGTGSSTSSQRKATRSAATAAASAFVEVLGRALEARVADYLGRPALATVMSALLHCWPMDLTGNTTAGAELRTRAREETITAVVGRGFAMGWWSLEPDSSVRSGGSGCPMTEAAGEGAPEGFPRNNGGVGGSLAGGRAAGDAQPDGGSGRTRVGCLDDDSELAGGTCSHPAVEALEEAVRRRREADLAAVDAQAVAAAAAAVAAGEKKEEGEMWRSLAEGAQTHVLPHLHEILKKTYTIARYAQNSSSSLSSHSRRLATTSQTTSVAPRQPLMGQGTAATIAGSSAGGALMSASTTVFRPTGLEVDAGVALELHASAALVSLRGVMNGIGGASASNSRGVRQWGKPSSSDYQGVRDRYLDVHRMAHNPLFPQQRLLAPAFFCLALDRACGGEGGDYRGAVNTREGDPHAAVRSGGLSFPWPAAPLREALRGKEWELLQLWMQAAFDPLAFPTCRRRGDRDRRRRSRDQGQGVISGGGDTGASEPSDLVGERFEDFTRCLRVAFGSGVAADAAGGGDRGGGGRREVLEQELGTPPLDALIAGVFEKRLTRFEPAQLDALSPDEARVLARILDAQSVLAHCGGLWGSAVVIYGPGRLPEADRKQIKDRVVKLAHSAIKSLRRFLPEVFPREQEGDWRRDGGVESGGVPRAGSPFPRYGSAFRRIYGHAAYSLAAFLMRMCGGALRGLPLRELVEACFDGIACRPVGAGSGGGGVGHGQGAGGSSPNTELTALAITHLPDLLQCFSEMPMTVAPVTDWIKNINDNAINGDDPNRAAVLPLSSSVADPSPVRTPLIVSLASGLRGDLQYPSGLTNVVDRFGDFAAATALAPPPRPDRTALPNRLSRMRLEVLGDRKLRVARFLMEAAVAGKHGAGGAGAGTRSISVKRTSRLLVLVKEVFRHHEPPSRGMSSSSTAAPASPPPTLPLMRLKVLRDVVPLMRPIYSLLGEALLGEPGPARQLGREAVAAAVALSVAGLDDAFASAPSLPPATGCSRDGVEGEGKQARGVIESTAEHRVAECFAETVVLAMSTNLDTFVHAMGVDESPSGRGSGSAALLAGLGPRESELEQLLAELGAWEPHGNARGWPHHTLPSAAPRAESGREGDGGGDTSLQALLEEARAMATALRLSWGEGRRNEVVSRRVQTVLVPRIEACSLLLAGSGQSGVV